MGPVRSGDMNQPREETDAGYGSHEFQFVALDVPEEGLRRLPEKEPPRPHGKGPEGRPGGVEKEEPLRGNGAHPQGEGNDVAQAIQEPEPYDYPRPEAGGPGVEAGHPRAQSRPPGQEPRPVKAPQVKSQLVSGQASRKGRPHDPRQVQVPQVHRQTPKNEDGFAFQEGADEDRRVSVAEDETFKGHVFHPFPDWIPPDSGDLWHKCTILWERTGKGVVGFFLQAACLFLARPLSARAALPGGGLPGKGNLPLLLTVSFLLLTVLLVLALALVVRRARPFLGFTGSVLRSVGQAVSGNPDVKKLLARHPRLFSFLGRRLDRDTLTGLPATLLGLAFIFLLFQFLGVVQDLLATDPIVAADLRTANLFATLRTEGFNRFFFFVTLLGKWPVVLAFSSTVSGLLLLWRRWTFLPGLWLCLGGGVLSTWVGKTLFHRQRPAVAQYVEWSYSFPSGHAVISVALYGFLVYLAWRFAPRKGLRLLALLAGTGVILAIGISRLYLGVHYLSDVWGGYLLGLMWLTAGIGLSEASAMRWPLTGTPSAGSFLRAASWISALLAMGVYLALGSVYHPPPKTAPLPTPLVVEQDVASLFRDRPLPRYTETLTGQDQEPLSFVIVASDDRTLVDAFQRAGWTLAARETLGSLVRAGRAALADKPDPAAPMTPSFWNSRPHDFGFEKPLAHATVRERHHARFWKTGLAISDGSLLYVGTASLDIGLKWGIAHRIQANIDAEREYLFSDLSGSGVIRSFRKTDFVEPLYGHNFIGDPFFTDGKVYLVVFRNPLPPAPRPEAGQD